MTATTPKISYLGQVSRQGPSRSGAQARGREPETPTAFSQDVVFGGRCGDRLVAGLEGEPISVLHDPEEEIQLSPVGEGVEDAILPDHLGYRGVLVLVPVP